MSTIQLPKHWSLEQADAVAEILGLILAEIQDLYREPTSDIPDDDFPPPVGFASPPPLAPGDDDFSEDIPF